jgi:UbiD family decarboxylase
MAMLTALGTELYTKQVIVVDEDVDIYDLEDVMWAVATRVKAEKDVLMVPGVKAAIIDPSSDPTTFTVTKMGIDATAPINEEFAQRLIISPEQRSRAREILAGANVI